MRFSDMENKKPRTVMGPGPSAFLCDGLQLAGALLHHHERIVIVFGDLQFR